MKWMGVVVLALLLGCDRAKDSYDECVRLAGTATVQSLESARDACEKATKLDANSISGKAASTKLDALRGQIAQLQAAAEAVPDTVSEGWCDRLGARLFDHYLSESLSAEQQKQYSQRKPEGYLREILRDYVSNQVVNCKDDSGKSTAGYWSCLWNSRYDNYEQCKRPPRRRG